MEVDASHDATETSHRKFPFLACRTWVGFEALPLVDGCRAVHRRAACLAGWVTANHPPGIKFPTSLALQ